MGCRSLARGHPGAAEEADVGNEPVALRPFPGAGPRSPRRGGHCPSLHAEVLHLGGFPGGPVPLRPTAACRHRAKTRPWDRGSHHGPGVHPEGWAVPRPAIPAEPEEHASATGRASGPLSSRWTSLMVPRLGTWGATSRLAPLEETHGFSGWHQDSVVTSLTSRGARAARQDGGVQCQGLGDEGKVVPRHLAQPTLSRGPGRA